jgi:hypoxia up-regulated 1
MHDETAGKKEFKKEYILSVILISFLYFIVALNFAVNREIGKEPESHIFYDMGAGSTVASIVTFSNVETKDGKKTRTAPQLEVRGVGFDRTLGGHEIDVRVQSLLATGFMKLNQDRVKQNIKSSDGAMTRLLKEANRVKQILSANTETTASVSFYSNGIFKKEKSNIFVTRLKIFMKVLTSS